MIGQKHMLHSFFRFAAVGVSFSLIYAVVTSALISVMQAPAFLTSVAVYLICIPLAFVAQRRFAFDRAQPMRGGVLVYGAVQIVALVAVSFVSSRFVQGVWAFDTVLYFVTAGAAAVVSFAISRFVIFKGQRG